MSYEEVAAKFSECAEFARWNAVRAKDVIGMVRDLEELASIGRLTEALRSK